MNAPRLNPTRIATLFSCLTLAIVLGGRSFAEPVGSKPPPSLRVYFMGNSVTDTVRYSALAKLAKSRNVTLDWGRTMVPGAPLEHLYTHPGSGFNEPPCANQVVNALLGGERTASFTMTALIRRNHAL